MTLIETKKRAVKITVGDLLAQKGASLQLEPLMGDTGLDRAITVPEVSSPGLVLAGFTQRFASQRLHALGETEIAYLQSLSSEARRGALEKFLSYELPCVIVTKAQKVPPQLLEIAQQRRIPILVTKLKTAEFYRRITPYLAEVFAPATTVHGSLADVFGVGLLFIGRSGIGKSECVLDLVERGHRLVADDLVHIKERGQDVLIGQADEVTYRHMEIRGVGLVDVSSLFGIQAVRRQKRIEVVVELCDWDSAKDVDRTGLDGRTTNILGVELAHVQVPLNTGKNITVISEVVALNYLLKWNGEDPAQRLNERLIRRMAEQRQIRAYLTEDYE